LCIATSYGLGVAGLDSLWGKEIFSSLKPPRTPLVPTQPHIQSIPLFFPFSRGKITRALGFYVGHSPPFTADVMNKWSHTSTPLACFHVVKTDHFTVSIVNLHIYLFVLAQSVTC
jgi:hypothetical protein